ncbi:phospholipase A2 A2-actitoxin-Cgg2a [Nematostella vectensis]|uniref:phospholipase A2 A2-actitoxin-Cgg2a n=1 Tax=Nematostella vectensis TaxID=45351 RepID=UPI002076E45F|nr:phospholipase A2 A2-actitoxin-Cgg2a [Nematostella vectensis]
MGCLGKLVLALVYVCMASFFVVKVDARILSEKSLRDYARERRSLFDFHAMIKCETKRNPLDYNYYGCYCGFGGRGSPVDGLDKCCYVHDMCYKASRTSGICWAGQAYIHLYYRTGCTGCDKAKNSKCGQMLCECDAAAAKCFAANKIDKKYEDYPQSKC